MKKTSSGTLGDRNTSTRDVQCGDLWLTRCNGSRRKPNSYVMWNWVSLLLGRTKSSAKCRRRAPSIRGRSIASIVRRPHPVGHVHSKAQAVQQKWGAQMWTRTNQIQSNSRRSHSGRWAISIRGYGGTVYTEEDQVQDLSMGLVRKLAVNDAIFRK